MTDEEAERRHSKALEPELIKDPTLKAEAEAANGLKQYDLALQLLFMRTSESMGNHDSEIVDAGGVD
jgi:hypothetical protein